MTTIAVGQWTPTGWGAQHRVRASDPDWTRLVCHTASQRVETSEINTAAAETKRCSRCATIPALGPLAIPTLGDKRRDPTTGAVVVCERTWDGRTPATPVDRCWHVTDPGTRPADAPWWLDTYDVADWPTLEGDPR